MISRHIALLFALVPVLPLAGAGKTPPHIVFIAIDDLNDWIGCLGGHPDVKTPHMDRLARRGLLFTNAHCQVPVCLASRVSVLSGRLATTSGCYDFNAEFHEAPRLADAIPNPLHLKNHGYHTLGGGKPMHHGFHLGEKLTTARPTKPSRRANSSGAATRFRSKVFECAPCPDDGSCETPA